MAPYMHIDLSPLSRGRSGETVAARQRSARGTFSAVDGSALTEKSGVVLVLTMQDCEKYGWCRNQARTKAQGVLIPLPTWGLLRTLI